MEENRVRKTVERRIRLAEEIGETVLLERRLGADALQGTTGEAGIGSAEQSTENQVRGPKIPSGPGATTAPRGDERIKNHPRVSRRATTLISENLDSILARELE